MGKIMFAMPGVVKLLKRLTLNKAIGLDMATGEHYFSL